MIASTLVSWSQCKEFNVQLKLAEAVQKYKSVASFFTALPLQIYFINLIIMLYSLIFFFSLCL